MYKLSKIYAAFKPNNSGQKILGDDICFFMNLCSQNIYSVFKITGKM